MFQDLSAQTGSSSRLMLPGQTIILGVIYMRIINKRFGVEQETEGEEGGRERRATNEKGKR